MCQSHPVAPSAEYQPLMAFRRASEKLNDVITSQHQILSTQTHHYEYPGNSPTRNDYTVSERHEQKEASISITRLTNDHDSPPHVSQFSIDGPSSDREPSVLAPPMPVLPSLHISDTSFALPWQRHDPTSTSPRLARFAIIPDGHHYQTLPKLQSPRSPATASGQTSNSGQTLPSLETALNSATDSNGTPFVNGSPALTRPSPSEHSQYALSPAAYSQATPVLQLPPPRFSTNSASWRTLSQNSSLSMNSDHASAQGSNHASTPATRPSPSFGNIGLSGCSKLPILVRSETVMLSCSETGCCKSDCGSSPQGYSCTFPGCIAPPFQTQHMLYSHTNVHSNQGPHFCPVENCPRGPGGQGFKRRNEMIRHGLVHTSPSYVCPFCPDQQHKYPRPDNLQRHVRVHHVDRDRDDPQLRDALAQRREEGNRGRRRRLGG